MSANSATGDTPRCIPCGKDGQACCAGARVCLSTGSFCDTSDDLQPVCRAKAPAPAPTPAPSNCGATYGPCCQGASPCTGIYDVCKSSLCINGIQLLEYQQQQVELLYEYENQS